MPKAYSGNKPISIHPDKLAFDIDGVFADTFRAFIGMAERDYGISIEYDEITEYDFWKVVDINETICREIIQRILDEPLGVGMMPAEGAVSVIERLAGKGPILFVTARPERDSILQWINEYLVDLDPALIQIEAVGSHEEKAPVLLRNGVKYFVEDRLETCYILDKVSVVPIVFDQPWNRKQHPFLTVRNWIDICEMIEW
jgi:uncharacterized HAD superfamily protein